MASTGTQAGPELPELPTSARNLVDRLCRPGPHAVLRGDLGPLGVPGAVFAPAEGLGLPAVVLGHDWMQSADRYLPLLRHLASWGIVAAAPDTQRGPLPSYPRFSADLRATLETCARVRLGNGAISVDRGRLALAGHGTGGGCAVLATAEQTGPDAVAAVVTLAVSATKPSAVAAAATVSAPSLHLAAGKDQVSPLAAGAEPLAASWAGPVVLRTLPKANHLGFLAGRAWVDALVPGGPQVGTARLTRALVTGFLLSELLGMQGVAELMRGEIKGTELVLSR